MSTGEIKIDIQRLIKKIKKSALEDFESHIFLLNRNLIEFLNDFPLKKISHMTAITTETTKYPT